MKKANKTLTIIAVILAIVLIAVVLLILNSLGIIVFGKQSPKPVKMTCVEDGSTLTYNYDYDNKTLYAVSSPDGFCSYFLPLEYYGKYDKDTTNMLIAGAPWYLFNTDIQRGKITKVVDRYTDEYATDYVSSLKVNNKKQVIERVTDREDGYYDKYTYQYDSKGNLIKITVDSNVEGAEIGDIIFTYKNGKVSSVTDKTFDVITTDFSYDKDGRIVKAHEHCDDPNFYVNNVTLYTYSEDGDLIAARTDAERDDGTHYITNDSYQYTKHLLTSTTQHEYRYGHVPEYDDYHYVIEY